MKPETFTNGEWSVNKEHCWVDGSWGINMNGHHCAATVVTMMDDGTAGSVETLRLEANAYLIAASPDMYRELQADVDRINSILSDFEFAIINEPLIAERDRKVVLLAKARGES